MALRQLRGQARSQDQLSTEHLHWLPVVFEVAEPVRLPADGLHFVVKAFGNSVGTSEAPHARNLFRLGMQRVAEDDELRQSGQAQLVNRPEESRDQLFTLAAGLVLLQQQVAEPLFEAVDDVQRRPLRQIREQPNPLVGLEIVAMTSHQRHQAAIL